MLLSHDAFRRLCRARDLLSEMREPPLSLTDISREVRMSPFHLIRQFESVFGVTPHQFRIRARLDYARQLLAADQHSVTDVCMELGWSSLGSFSDLFTRRIGTTPSAYRRRARVLIQVPDLFSRHLFPGCLSLMGALPATAFRNFREAPALPASLESPPCKSN